MSTVSLVSASEPTINQNDDALVVTLGPSLRFEFALADDIVLGLAAVSHNELALTHASTLLFPVVAEEFGEQRRIASYGRLLSAERDGTGVRIRLELLASRREADFRNLFLFGKPRGETDGEVDIYRDYYDLAHLQLPSSFTIAQRAAQLPDYLAAAEPVGTLEWVLEPSTHTIAGWTWQGYRQHFELALVDDMRVNALRTLGTWELGGHLDQLTVVNMRYRGLGRIEQPLTTDDVGGVHETFTTTEILPGATDGAYQVSPILPRSDAQPDDRTGGLLHRRAAWIAHLARGAGVAFIDYQFRPEAMLTAFHERQGDLRAMTETFPGDVALSHTDEEWFALTNSHRTIPQHILVLPAPAAAPWTRDESRNRWLEVDQYTRDLISAELDFVQHEVQPSVGVLWEFRYGEEVDHLTALLPSLAASGVRQVLVHNPGWINGGSLRRAEDGLEPGGHHGGGNCNVYDWRFLPGIQDKWAALGRALDEHGVAAYMWLSGMSKLEGDFVQRIGTARDRWALNRPDSIGNDTYGLDMLKHNPASNAFLTEFQRTFDAVYQSPGFQGWWGDSAQNLFFSQFSWADGSGRPLGRVWWEEIARWSRLGVAWQAESIAVPGQSCSIEVSHWEDDLWYFAHTNKWLRGNGQANYEPAALSRMLFRAMAVKGWLAPDLIINHWNRARQPTRVGIDVIPHFERFAQAYLSVQPEMARPYLLPNQVGVLWLPADRADRGALFLFSDLALPTGTAATIVNQPDTSVTTMTQDTVYQLTSATGGDLRDHFGIRRPDAPDHRRGQVYQPPQYHWPTRQSE